MKLSELEPRWISDGVGRFGLGLAFDCPCCRARRLAAWFAQPLDGGPAYEGVSRTERDGSSFDEITLVADVGADGHWHGDVVQGEVR